MELTNYQAFEKLISKHYYSEREEVCNKVDKFYQCNRLTDEEYVNLYTLIGEQYPAEVVEQEEPEEETETEVEETEGGNEVVE